MGSGPATGPAAAFSSDVSHGCLIECFLLKIGYTTDMNKITATSRHQAVTTTLARGNQLEHAQEVFEETSKILLKK